MFYQLISFYHEPEVTIQKEHSEKKQIKHQIHHQDYSIFSRESL